MQPSLLIVGEATGQSQGRPSTQPISHILIRETPKGFEQCHQQQTLLAVLSRGSSWTFGQRRRTAVMSKTNSQPAKRQKMQGRDQGQSIDVKGFPGFGL